MTTTQIIEALAQSGHMIQIELIEDGGYLVSMEAPPSSSDYLEPYDGTNIDEIFQQIRVEILRAWLSGDLYTWTSHAVRVQSHLII